MDLSSEIEQQAYLDDVRLNVKDPGMKCTAPSPAELSLQKRIVGILESMKGQVFIYQQDSYGAPEGGWMDPVMERMREIANEF